MSRVISAAVDRGGLAPAARATRLIFLVSGIGMAAWAPMVPYAKARLGLDDASLGLVLLAFGGGSMAAMPLVGWLTQRYGHRRVIGVGGLLLCLALPGLALASTAIALATILLCFGMALGAVDVAMNAHAVEVERRAGRPMMSGFHGLFSVGGLGGALGMSVLLALGASLLVAAVLVALLLAVMVVTQWYSLLERTSERTTRKAFAMPRGIVLLLGLLCFISFLAEGAMLDWSAVFLREFRGFDAATAGIGYAGFSVAMALVRLVGDRVVARIGPVLTVRLGAALAAAGFLLATLVAWPPAALPSSAAGGTARLRAGGFRRRQHRAGDVRRGWPAAGYVAGNLARHGDHAGLRGPAQRPGPDRLPGPGQQPGGGTGRGGRVAAADRRVGAVGARVNIGGIHETPRTGGRGGASRVS